MNTVWTHGKRRLALSSLSLLLLCLSFLLTPTIGYAHSASTGHSGCAQLPSGVDPTSLSARELAYYGLPARAAGMSQSQWKGLVQGAKQRVCTTHATRQKHHFVPSSKTHAKATSYSYNWSGYVSSGDGGYTFAYSSWTTPCLSASSPAGTSLVWVGLGGWGNDNLVQTGTYQEVSYDAYGNPTYTYFAWVENVAYAANPWINEVFSINCGDAVGAYIFSDGTMFINDVTSGTYTTQRYGPAANTGTADFVVERPTVGGSYTNLSDFQSVTLNLNYVQTVGGTTLYLANTVHDSVIMVGDDGLTSLDSVGAIDTGNYNAFTVNWQRDNS